MSIGRTIEESLLKAVRSLEIGACHLYLPKFDGESSEDLLSYIRDGRDDRLFAIAELIRRHKDLGIIANETQIDMLFLHKIKNIVDEESVLCRRPGDVRELAFAKRMGFSDKYIGMLWNMSEEDVYGLRRREGVIPAYKMIDTCASEFDSYIPYFYSTYEDENESEIGSGRKIIVLGSGPITIDLADDFDYSTVHAVKTIKANGYEAIIINNNPETVSTDYTISDKLYFEPLTVEDVMNIIDL